VSHALPIPLPTVRLARPATAGYLLLCPAGRISGDWATPEPRQRDFFVPRDVPQRLQRARRL